MPAPERQSDPCVLVIFGASGDLTRRLFDPLVVYRAHDNLLTQNFAVGRHGPPGLNA